MELRPFRIERFYAVRADRRAAEVVVTSCAEEGISLLYHALLQTGDHLIVETPCYESAPEVARSTGAEVSQWEHRYEDGWAHDLDAVTGMIRPATRLLYERGRPGEGVSAGAQDVNNIYDPLCWASGFSDGHGRSPAPPGTEASSDCPRRNWLPGRVPPKA